VQRLKQEGNCESRVLSFSISITNSRLGVLYYVYTINARFSAFCFQLDSIGYDCGIIYTVIENWRIEVRHKVILGGLYEWYKGLGYCCCGFWPNL